MPPQALTIPEDLAMPRTKPKSLIYLVKLLNGSSYTLIGLYILCIFIIKPALLKKDQARLELLDTLKHNLFSTYLKMVEKVKNVPFVALRRNGKLMADSGNQTESNDPKTATDDNLEMGQIIAKLRKISESLYEMDNLGSIRSELRPIGFILKEFQNFIDLTYYSDFFKKPTDKKEKKNVSVVVDVRNEIRSIKGLYMSGQI